MSSSLTTSDCHTSITDDGYWESWHVRVASSGSVTFAVTSSFDSYLEILRVDDTSDVAGSTVFLDEDDDGPSGDGDLDALLIYTLQVNTDYAIVVSGYDDSETGSYTLTMSQ